MLAKNTMQLFYNLIYSPFVNKVLRNVNYIFRPILPFKIHPSGTLISKYEGVKLRFKTNQTSYVTRELFWKGAKNYEYTTIFSELIKGKKMFFDVGASIGYYSVLAASINKNLNVVSFEPSIGPMVYLSENVKINYLSNQIKVEPIALSSENGKLPFSNIINKKYPSTYNLSGEHNLGTKPNLESKVTMVESLTLDEYVIKNNIKVLDLIKLDTEGNENAILNGASSVLGTLRPIIICETLFDRIEEELEEIILKNDYELYDHYPNGLTKVNSIQRKTDNGVRDCFFVPKEKVHLIEKFLT